MILQVSPDAPAWVHAAAATVLVLHIGGGSVGMVSGGAAMVFRKGSRLHRMAGNIFFLAMLTMAGIGAAVAPFLPDRVSTFAGLLTVYMTATAWATVKRPAGQTGLFEILAMLWAFAVAAGAAWLYAGAQAAGVRTIDGQSISIAIAFIVIATACGMADLTVILRRGVSGAQRTARHLWRMGLALFVAVGSFFQGQPQVFPRELRGSLLLVAPTLIVIVLTIFWLIHTLLFSRSRKRAPS